MKSIIAAICASTVLIGCACDPVIKTQVVTVNKPIPFIPSPPTVPTLKEYETSKLTREHQHVPGVVGQAYVHDMTFLRKRIEIDDLILEQYRKGSVDFKQIEAKINELYKDINVESLPDTVDTK